MPTGETMKNRGAWLSPILTIMLAISVVIGAMVLVSNPTQPVQIEIHPPLASATPQPSAMPGPITVYVTGAVGQPESMITLPPGSRVQDAVAASGGLNDDADTTRVNMAAILRDGDQVHIPAQTDAEITLATPQGGAVVYINTATFEELDALPGVGATLAQAILNYREANGNFTSFEDLDAVEGIGEGMIERLRELVVFE